MGVYIFVVVAIADGMHINFGFPAFQTLRQQYALLLCSTEELQQIESVYCGKLTVVLQQIHTGTATN